MLEPDVQSHQLFGSEARRKPILHERVKVTEAAFFLKLMEERSSIPQDFRHFLSAFLSAARSALQYALEEARARRQQTWYDKAMQASPVLAFFKDKRDVNIHKRPIALMQTTTLTETVHIGISDGLVVITERADGTTETREVAGTPGHVAQRSTSLVEVQYLFDDWQGPEDALALSKKYLTELKLFIDGGVKAGHISG